MIAEEEAREKVLEKIQVRASRRVSLLHALNCFAAEDYFSSLPLPNFDNSAMDGYAVVASASGVAKRMRVIGEQPAGLDRKLRVSPGEAIRIFTGAPMPAGADAVVMQEETEREGDSVLIRCKQILPGDFVRKAAADLAVGQQILCRGDGLRPASLGLLASQGIELVQVGERA